MFPGYFVGRWAVAEIIECERFASHTLRTLQWVRIAVIGKVGGPKDHDPIEDCQWFVDC